MPPNPPRNRKRRRTLLALAVGVLLLGVALEIGVRTAGLPRSLGSEIQRTPIILDRHGATIAELPSADARQQIPVPYEKMSPWLTMATVGLEDQRFWRHRGVDVRAIGSALIENVRHRRVVSGASTITQQLIKNATPRRSRSYPDKIQESLAAIHLERVWSKRKILTRYLNQVSYGNRLLGAEAAARNYFGKPAADLTPQEAVFLAGLPRSPTAYNPWKRPDNALARYRNSLGRLAAAKLITGEQRSAWLTTPPAVQHPGPAVRNAPHFLDYLQRLPGTRSGTVHSTLDLGLQRQLESIVSLHVKRLSRHGVRQAAAVVLDHRNGAVRAWVGSPDFRGIHGQIDGVTTPRSSGSTLKPFIYLNAIDRRVLTAATLLPDTPDAIRAHYPDYDPKNYDQRYWGPVRVREALANSLNVPAVVALSQVGARSAHNFLSSAGIETPQGFEEYGAGLILGNAEVRLLDVTAAFGVFANQGSIALPVALKSTPPTHRLIASKDSAQIIADILADNDARRKSFGPFTPLAFESRRIPCKTGTSSGFRDAWTIGSTGRHCVGVWIGNFSGEPMREIASVTGPAPLWRDIVVGVLGDDPDVAAPEESTSLTRTEICTTTGLKPSQESAHSSAEWFLSGTEPTASAKRFFREGSDGAPVLALPAEYAIWCESSHNYLGATVATTGPLRILIPRDGARFTLDQHIQRNRQNLELRAVGGGGAPLNWILDGAPLPAAPQGHDISIPLVGGIHRLSVSDGNDVASVSFSVEE